MCSLVLDADGAQHKIEIQINAGAKAPVFLRHQQGSEYIPARHDGLRS